MRFFYLFLCLLFLGVRSCRAEDIWYLRIIARDDSPAAQEEKLALRDHLLPLFPDRAKELPRELPGIVQAALRFTACRVEIKAWAPHKKTPPAPTVYITIGEGGGHNWWGILYRDAHRLLPSSGLQAQPGEPVHFSWPFLGWLKDLFCS